MSVLFGCVREDVLIFIPSVLIYSLNVLLLSPLLYRSVRPALTSISGWVVGALFKNIMAYSGDGIVARWECLLSV